MKNYREESIRNKARVKLTLTIVKMPVGKMTQRHYEEEAKLLQNRCAFLEKSNENMVVGTELENCFD